MKHGCIILVSLATLVLAACHGSIPSEATVMMPTAPEATAGDNTPKKIKINQFEQASSEAPDDTLDKTLNKTSDQDFTPVTAKSVVPKKLIAVPGTSEVSNLAKPSQQFPAPKASN